VTAEELVRALERRAPGQWELYRKSAESREVDAAAVRERGAWRREEGWAARWWESGVPRFAAASSAVELEHAIGTAGRFAAEPSPPPDWPSRRAELAGPAPLAPPPAVFADLARAVASASRGDAALLALTVRRGNARERLVNAAGLDVSQERRVLDGVATAVGRRGAHTREARLAFRSSGDPAAPEIEGLARRLSDAATLPLSDRPAPIASGQWLLDPAVASAVLAAIAPLFTAERPPRWIGRGPAAWPGLTIADDPSTDAPFDGEGVPTRRTLLVEDGMLVGRLLDLSAARRAGLRSTGHATRPSYREPPRPGPGRIFFETRTPTPPAELLASVKRGLFAAALTAVPRVDLDADRYAIEFTGVSIVAGRAQGPVAGARATGRISELLRRIAGLSTDLQFFPMPFPSGSPTVLVERAAFD
jgi:predicted Zn-dependent protease